MSTNAPASGAHDEQSPWTQPRFVGAAVIVGLIVVLAVVLMLSGSKEKAAAPAAAAPPPAAATPPSPGASRGACGLPRGGQDVPTTGPSNTRWELVGKMIAPTAPKTIGPGRAADGYRTCFAHSPTGALYAAVNFWAAGTAHPSADVYRHLAAESAARATAIKASRGRGSPRLAGLQVAAFAFSSYEPDRATIKLAFRLDSGRLLEAETTMLWTNGDWRYQVPLDQRPATGQLETLDGLIRWTGS